MYNTLSSQMSCSPLEMVVKARDRGGAREIVFVVLCLLLLPLTPELARTHQLQ